MKNLNCNQIKIFINLKIIGEEDKNQIYIYIISIFLIKKSTKFFAIWCYHLAQP